MFEERYLITFLIDKSNSMFGQRIEFVIEGLFKLKNILLNSNIPFQFIDVSIVLYGDYVESYYYSVPLKDLPQLEVHCGGGTAMKQAIEQGIALTDEWIKRNQVLALTYKTPLMVIFTDGSPTDNLDDSFISQIKHLQSNKRFILLSAGIGNGHNEKLLKSLLTNQRNYANLSEEEYIVPFFEELAQSVIKLYSQSPVSNHITSSSTSQEYFDYETKCFCVLALDCSNSMNIVDLNKALQKFKQVNMQDKITRDRLEVAIVTFNSEIKVLQEASALPNVKMPTLEASCQSILVPAIVKAQDMIDQRIDYYKSMGIPYYKPWIITMTDGNLALANQDLRNISTKIKNDVYNKKYEFFILGIGDNINYVNLSKLAPHDCSIIPLEKVLFDELFTWMSYS